MGKGAGKGRVAVAKAVTARRVAARKMFAKDVRINVRLPRGLLKALQNRAFEEGLPYQTLITSILHKYASGRLVEWREGAR